MGASVGVLGRGKMGLYQPLNDLLPDSVFASVSQNMLLANTDEEGNIYGIPFMGAGYMMLYNLNLLKDAGADPNNLPTTWEEFIDVCSKLKSAGIVPIAFANKEGIMNEQWGIGLVSTYFDNVKDQEAFWYNGKFVGNADYNDLLEKYKYLYQQGYFDPEGATGAFVTDFFAKFLSGKVAIIWVWTGMQGDLEGNEIVGYEDVGVALLPDFGGGELAKHMQTDANCFAISNWTPYAKEAAKAIEYLLSEKWQKEYLKFGEIPEVDVDSTGFELTSIQEWLLEQKRKGTTPGSYGMLIGTQYDTIIRNCTYYLNDEMNYDQFALELEEASTLE